MSNNIDALSKIRSAVSLMEANRNTMSVHASDYDRARAQDSYCLLRQTFATNIAKISDPKIQELALAYSDKKFESIGLTGTERKSLEQEAQKLIDKAQALAERTIS